MRDLAGGLSDAEKRDLLATVIDESERLNRFIANLLDMTKLESGAIVPNTALHDIGEIVGSVLRRASKILAHHKVALELAADMPMLELDAVLFEQALFNLLDNAAKYAPAGHHDLDQGRAGPRIGYPCISSTRATAFRRRSWRACSTSSIARKRAIMSGPAPASGWRFPAALSRPCMARSRRPTAATAAAPC